MHGENQVFWLRLETRHTLGNSQAETSTTAPARATKEGTESGADPGGGEPTAGGGAADDGNIPAETTPARWVCSAGQGNKHRISGNTIVFLTG